MKLTDFKEFVPGTALKLVSFSGRLLFLFAVLPELLEGQLAEYAFLATVALLSARLAAMGLEDQLPLEIRGQRARAERFLRGFAAVQVLVLVAGLVYLVSGTSIPAVLFLAAAYLAQQMLSGVVRSISPLGFELLANLYWLSFPVICLLAGAQTAVGIIGLMAIVIVINQIIVIRLTGLSLSIPRRPMTELLALTACMKQGWQKCLSGFSTLANMRSLILWPKMLGKTHAADSLAFALLCAEAIWQFGMVVVNRKYANFCAAATTTSDRLRDTIETISWLVSAFIVLAAGMYFGQPVLVRVADLPWQLIAVATAMFGFAAGFLLLRFYTWASRGFSWKLAGLDVALFISIGGIVFNAEPANWPVAALVAFCTHFSAALVISIVESSTRDSRRWRSAEPDFPT